MWVYCSVATPLSVFDFTVSRHRDGPDLMLADSSGTLPADCYSDYQGISLRGHGRIRRAACVAHAGRKVFNAQDNYPLESSLILAKFQQFYDIEDRAKTLSIDEHAALRQNESAAVWQSLGEWLDGQSASCVLPESKLGEALGYAAVYRIARRERDTMTFDTLLKLASALNLTVELRPIRRGKRKGR